MTIIERIQSSLEKKARRILRDIWSSEGKVEEFQIGRARRLVWNDGATVEVSETNGRVFGMYKITVSVRLTPMFPTPTLSSIPIDKPFDSDRVRP